MLFGYARHGKDTVADIFVRKFATSAISSSWYSTLRVMTPYFVKLGTPYVSPEECYADRVNHRKEWFDEIAAYNNPDLARLVRNIFSEYNIYTGCRNDREFNQAKCEGLFHYSVWVDRSAHLPAEKEESNKMKPWMADFILDNNGTLAELEERASVLYLNLQQQIASGVAPYVKG